jgi:hypothetical protein
MGNTIDWGQAAVNNTIGFGDGAENNTIGWGDIQADSWSPETNLTGTGATPAYSNVNSFTFDGISDSISMGDVLNTSDDATSPFSVSLWFKTTSTAQYMQLFGKQLNVSPYNGYALQVFAGATQSQFRGFFGTLTGNARLTFQTSYSADVRSGNWNNVIMTYDGSQVASGIKVYLNGNSITVTAIISNTPADLINTADLLIGARGVVGATALEFDGNIDEVSYFNSVLTAGNVATIYGSAIPTSLTPLSPLGWWRMGEEAVYTTLWTLTDQGSGGNDGTSSTLPAPPAQPSTDVPT